MVNLSQTPLPILALLHPRQHTLSVWLALLVGLVVGWATIRFGDWPLWAATAIVLLALLPVGIRKWGDDRVRYGTTIMLLSILLTSQGAHTIEHLVQWVQYHVLFWTARQSTGLLSPANAEWVHFVWNWSVFLMVVALIRGGIRNLFSYALFVVALFHGIEHTYTTVRYHLILRELHEMGVFNVTAQGLAGICGRDGWLARSPWTEGTFIRGLPGITTAIRLDVHFWWNTLEIGLLLLAGHFYLRGKDANPAEAQPPLASTTPLPTAG
jgi:hypothetical protein